MAIKNYTTMDPEKWNWIMSRFLRSERDGH